MPAMPIADSNAPMVVGISVTNKATSTIDRDRAAGISRIARDRHRREHEDDGQTREQDVERDLVRRLLTLGAFDQLDHAIDEGRALRRGDAHADPVRQHLRAAGHRRAIAARLADYRSRFAGDRRLVDGGHALDDLAVGRNVVARFHQHDVADLQAGAGHHPVGLVRSASAAWPGFSVRVFFRDSACALPRPSATASAKFANSTVNHSQRMIWKVKPMSSPPVSSVAQEDDRRQRGDDFDHEHDRVLDHRPADRA